MRAAIEKRLATASRYGLPVLWSGCLAIVFFAASCIPEESESVRFVNGSAEALFAQVNGGSIDPLAPAEAVTYTYLKTRIGAGRDPFRVDVYDDRGCRAMVFETTVEDFKERHNKTLTIREADLTPREERTDCDDI